MRGVPAHIRSDNGPEFIAQAIGRWLTQLEVETLYIEPGAPWENGYAESFHSRFRDECLATEEFENVLVARRISADWESAGMNRSGVANERVVRARFSQPLGPDLYAGGGDIPGVA